MNASLNEKLRTVKWGEYRLGDLFEITTAKSIDKNKIQLSNKAEYEFVGRSSENNGVQGYVEKLNYEPNRCDTFSVAQIGETVCLYREREWYASQNIFVLSPKIFEFVKQHAFITASINKALYPYSNAYIYPTLSELKEIRIQLPKRNGKINFDFMESFIAELEAERVAELSAYLTVSGLDNYELSSDEENAIEKLKAQQIPFVEFDILKVFDVKNTHNILSDDIVSGSGNVPYLGAGADNNSVNSYISYNNDYLEKGNCIFIGGKTFTVTYQEQDFFSNDSHNLALYEKEIVADKLQQLYIATCVKSSLSHKYTWGDSVSKAKIKTDKINLPTKDGKPDYDSMATLISAVQKLVIKDVVKYADEKTKTYHTVVGHNDKQKIECTYEIKSKPLMIADGDRADETSLLID